MIYTILINLLAHLPHCYNKTQKMFHLLNILREDMAIKQFFYFIVRLADKLSNSIRML